LTAFGTKKGGGKASLTCSKAYSNKVFGEVWKRWHQNPLFGHTKGMRIQKTGGKGEHWVSMGMKLSLAAKLKLMMESHLVSILETLWT
jgi:hypothetical protein